jgi:hypothetical protein
MADASSRLAGDLVDVALVSRGHPTAVGHACEVKKLDFTPGATRDKMVW